MRNRGRVDPRSPEWGDGPTPSRGPGITVTCNRLLLTVWGSQTSSDNLADTESIIVLMFGDLASCQGPLSPVRSGPPFRTA
jgi:hypothetical protein